ncbi:MAG: hypothetical protein QXX56_05460 [Candidatus Bathyarchaeia archaeon]
MERRYYHLVKPLIVRAGPEGLYPDMRIWMDSKDLGGVPVIFSYGFLKNQSVICHPTSRDKAVVHPYDEVLFFVGSDASDIKKLGGEISIEIGENPEEYIFRDPTVIAIPKNTPHGPITVNKLDRPIIHYLIGLNPEYSATLIQKESRSSEQKYARLVKKFLVPGVEDGVIYMNRFQGPGNADQAVFVDSRGLEGIGIFTSWGVYSKIGLWHKEPYGGPHTHPFDELLFAVGLDPSNLYYFGGSIEVALGDELERHIITIPSAVIAPKGMVHCPMITWLVDNPFGFIALGLNPELVVWSIERRERRPP